MKVEARGDGAQERQILTAMIVDRSVAGRVASKWEKPGLFKSRWANIVGSWVVKYYDKYGKAPSKSIQGLFESWAADNNDDDTIQLVESFLEVLSGEYAALKKEVNADYILDIADTYFNRIRLSNLANEITGDIDGGDMTEALRRVQTYGKLELAAGAGIDVLSDEEAVRAAMTEQVESIIRYPQALGNFFQDDLARDCFVAFQAPEKRGKTWWLIDLSWRAMLQGRRVAFFEVGDMSQNQLIRRLMVRVAKRPRKPTEKDQPVKYPIAITHEPDAEYSTVDLEERHYKGFLEHAKAWAACQKIVRKSGAKESLFRLSTHPNSSINVFGVKSILQTWERSGWIPDVVVVDYADILAPPHGVAESRDQINTTWKQLRALSQSFHCLVVTATQAKASSYEATTMGQEHFSEDKRKFAHVTGMVGINATVEEKKQGLSRLNWIVLRESDFIVTRCCHVAGCLSIGNPAIHSTF